MIHYHLTCCLLLPAAFAYAAHRALVRPALHQERGKGGGVGCSARGRGGGGNLLRKPPRHSEGFMQLHLQHCAPFGHTCGQAAYSAAELWLEGNTYCEA